MPLILPGNVASATAATGYNIANSCRFEDSGPATLDITPAGAGSSTKYTFAGWVKRGNLGGDQHIMSAAYVLGGWRYSSWMFNSSNQLAVRSGVYSTSVSSADFNFITNALYRDCSAWMHLVVAVDTTDGTAADRVKIYVNGVLLTNANGDFGTNDEAGSSVAGFFNRTNTAMHIGSGNGTNQVFDGYMSEIYWIDGLQYAASDFGEFDEDSPTIWKSKDSEDVLAALTMGTNGAFFDFKASDNLGNDANGGTDWSESGIAATDQSQDSPTNNFATWNPLIIPTANVPTFSNGNNSVTTQNASGKYFGAASTLGMTAGKWYAEFLPYGSSSNGPIFGIEGDFGERVVSSDNFLGSEPYSYAYMSDGRKVGNGSYSTHGDTYTDDDIIGIAVDLDNLKIYFAKNGTWQNSSDPTSGATGTGAAFTITAVASMATPNDGAYFFACSDYATGGVDISANFGNGVFHDAALSSAVADGNGYGLFEYAPPSGYLALCTKNLGSDGG